MVSRWKDGAGCSLPYAGVHCLPTTFCHWGSSRAGALPARRSPSAPWCFHTVSRCLHFSGHNWRVTAAFKCKSIGLFFRWPQLAYFSPPGFSAERSHGVLPANWRVPAVWPSRRKRTCAKRDTSRQNPPEGLLCLPDTQLQRKPRAEHEDPAPLVVLYPLCLLAPL